MKIMDIARAVAPKQNKIIGIRAGEKLHEQMIGEEDAPTPMSMMDTIRYCQLLMTGHPIQNVLTEASGADFSTDRTAIMNG